MRLAILQFAPGLAEVAANLERIGRAAADAGADLLVTPELAVTGYDVGDDAWRVGVPLPAGSPAPAALRTHGRPVLAGLIERGTDGVPYNVAALFDGELRFVHRKIYLPTYGMFDEARFFGRGGSVRAVELAGGWRAGVLVCEDFWHPGLAYVLAAAGIHLLIVLAAAPGRVVRAEGPRFASVDAWERIARTTAQLYGIYVALANRTGVEGGVTFAGCSLVCGPDGGIVGHAGDADECVLEAALSLDEVQRARRPYAHLRDDDPRLVAREIRRLGRTP